jgi:geranylgeranyl pyrophosphate synthase
MRQKKSVTSGSDFRIMIEVLDVLHGRSAKAISTARNELLAMPVEGKGHEALKYYATSWDDTSHPGILSLACEAVGGRADKAIPMQVATLILTAAMDIHDDVIDHSRTKNGRLTVFGKFGKDIALLTGDALWLKGFTLLHDAEGDFSHETKEAIAKTIRKNFYDVGNAHMLELMLRGNLDVSPQEYLRVLEMKASNISVHAAVGAIVGGGSPVEINNLEKYGRILGMLITLREEFVDVFELEELRNRVRNECLPLPLLYAIEDEVSKNLVTKILSKTKASERDAERIVSIVFDSKQVQILRKRMEDWSEQALQIVSALPRSDAATALSKLIIGTLEDL